MTGFFLTALAGPPGGVPRSAGGTATGITSFQSKRRACVKERATTVSRLLLSRPEAGQWARLSPQARCGRQREVAKSDVGIERC